MASRGSTKSQGSHSRNSNSKNTGSGKRSTSSSSGSRSSSSSKTVKASTSKSQEAKTRSLSSGNGGSKSGASGSNAATAVSTGTRIKNDIVAVVVVAFAVILMIAVCMTSDAYLTSRLSAGLHYGLGRGAYILPILVFIFGICIFMINRYELALSRIAIGMVLIFISIITLLGVNAPGVVNHEQALFADAYLLDYGGYLGNAIAYALLSLVGKAISWVLLVAVIVGALVLIGFSISGFFDWVLDKKDERRAQREEEEYVAPYGRARGLGTSGTGGNVSAGGYGSTGGYGSAEPAGFVPVGAAAGASYGAATVNLDQQGKTRLLGRHRKGAGSEVAGASASGSADGNAYGSSAVTQMLDSQGQTVMVADLRTRKLNGSDRIDWEAEIAAINQIGANPDFTTTLGFDGGSVATGEDPSGIVATTTGATAVSGSVTGSISASGDDLSEEASATVSGASPEEDFSSESMEGEAAAKAMAAAVAAGAVAAGGVAAKKAAKSASSKKSKKAAKTTLLVDGKQEDKEEGEFQLPDPKLLKKSAMKPRNSASAADLAAMGARLQETLHEFNVDADVVGWVHGPTVTLFKVALASGVRVNKITALSDDIALAFASQSVRIFSPIAGTSLVGIEIPNDSRENVLLGDVLPAAGEKPLLLAIGKDVEGNAITADLAKMPHLLIGGTTGSGKSVAINSMIMSVLMRATPDQVRMILIDPKRVELSLYNDIPHLFVPVVTDPHKAASTLAWAVQEMERRLKLFEEVGARNITQYSKMRLDALEEQDKRRAELEAQMQEELERAVAEEPEREDEITEELRDKLQEELDEFDEWEQMPSIMIVIDELADLMMVAGKDVETSISRIAQLARAAGIHMIVATQRPSTNVITGLIKANITNRIAFNVASGIDSRVILDTTGAEHLIGLGDLLLSKPELGKPLRIQGCFVGEDEINSVCKHLREQGSPDYHEDIFTTSVPLLDDGGSSSSSSGSGSDEDLLWEAAEIVVSSNLGSTSALQRRLKVGYARAGRIMDMLEDKGIVGPANGSKPREVYVDMMELEGLKVLDQAGKL